MWSHEYPFSMPDLRDAIQHACTAVKEASDYRKINHVPGSGFYTSKVTLATSAVRIGIPRAFQMPQQRKELEAYAQENPESLWVKKGNAHREVQIVNVSLLAADMEGSFVQKYVANPLLIDGKKFDLGIYVVITSVHPLRVYYYDTDVLLRFCREDYEPFDPLSENKYVVGDDYLPPWQVPSLAKYYVDLGLNFRQTLDAHLRTIGKDPEVVWKQVRQIVAEVFITQNQHMRKITAAYSSQSSFFELSRFDFVIDDELNVYLLEANMSPNLSSSHFPQNRLLYEQVLFNVFSLIGIATQLPRLQSSGPSTDMIVSERNIHVYRDECVSDRCHDCSVETACALCARCMTPATKRVLRDAYLEHINRGGMRRVLPKTAQPCDSVNNRDHDEELQKLWFDDKCMSDTSFCDLI